MRKIVYRVRPKGVRGENLQKIYDTLQNLSKSLSSDLKSKLNNLMNKFSRKELGKVKFFYKEEKELKLDKEAVHNFYDLLINSYGFEDVDFFLMRDLIINFVMELRFSGVFLDIDIDDYFADIWRGWYGVADGDGQWYIACRRQHYIEEDNDLLFSGVEQYVGHTSNKEIEKIKNITFMDIGFSYYFDYRKKFAGKVGPIILYEDKVFNGFYSGNRCGKEDKSGTVSNYHLVPDKIDFELDTISDKCKERIKIFAGTDVKFNRINFTTELKIFKPEEKTTNQVEKQEQELNKQQEAEEKARQEAEAKAREEAEEKARKEAEEKARQEAEKKARKEAEEKARQEAEKTNKFKKISLRVLVGIAATGAIATGIVLGILSTLAWPFAATIIGGGVLIGAIWAGVEFVNYRRKINSPNEVDGSNLENTNTPNDKNKKSIFQQRQELTAQNKTPNQQPVDDELNRS